MLLCLYSLKQSAVMTAAVKISAIILLLQKEEQISCSPYWICLVTCQFVAPRPSKYTRTANKKRFLLILNFGNFHHRQ